jgi:hypothetical protein
VDPTINRGTTTGYKKQLVAASWDEKTHETMLHCSRVAFLPVPAEPFRFNAKNALNQVRPNKIKKIFFIFNCVLFIKLVLNIIQ